MMKKMIFHCVIFIEKLNFEFFKMLNFKFFIKLKLNTISINNNNEEIEIP